MGSCSRVKGCHGDSTAETGTVRLVGGKKTCERERVKNGVRRRGNGGQRTEEVSV